MQTPGVVPRAMEEGMEMKRTTMGTPLVGVVQDQSVVIWMVNSQGSSLEEEMEIGCKNRLIKLIRHVQTKLSSGYAKRVVIQETLLLREFSACSG